MQRSAIVRMLVMTGALTGAPTVALLGAMEGLGCGPPAVPERPLPPPQVSDGLEDIAAWRAAGSEGVRSDVRGVSGQVGQAMRLSFDMAGTGGYAIATRGLVLDGSHNFEISFDLRGELPVNNFEVKLIDATGKNVWWFHRTDYEYPVDWRRLAIKKRQIEFAWGPASDKALGQIATLEIVVATGKGGGKGWIDIDQLVVRALPELTAPPPPVRAAATSSASDAGPALAVDGERDTAWRSDPLDPAGDRAAFTIDLGRERDIGGLIVHWATPWAVAYDVDVSGDGASWRTVGSVRGGNGGADPFARLETAARFVRLRLASSSGQGYALAELELVDLDTDTTLNRFVEALARTAPAGTFPRAQSGQQPYWTLVGVDGGHDSGLLSEDGAVELRSGGPSIEPFVVTGGKLTSWATAGATQSLDGRYLPIPSVTWHQPAWDLAMTALAVAPTGADRVDRAELAVRYVLRNTGDAPLNAQLVLAVRPFQVNPPAQAYNIPGGVSSIHELAWNPADSTLMINGTLPVRLLTAPRSVGLSPFHAIGFPVTPLPVSAPRAISLRDASGLASAAVVYELQIPPRQDATVVVVAPLFGDGVSSAPRTQDPAAPAAWFGGALADARADWHDLLDRVGFRVPDEAQPVVDTLRTSLAYMLLSRDGAMLRPGTRCYARAWIRDGAMISEALLRMGHPGVAAEFLRWFAPYQRADGKVPCCVGSHGAGPVPEHDSHGQLIYLVREVYRYTRDSALLRELWPRVLAAARYMDQLRQAERVPANRTGDRRPQWGLLAPSISHEGYINPAYSYWDNFWGLRGYRDAVWIAGELGERATAGELARQRDEFSRDLRASIDASVAAHHLAFIPGAADVGDFDATSTTIALAPTGVDDILPRDLLTATFERYFHQLVGRHDGTLPWKEYTPYELRAIGTFVRLGWRSRAADATRYMFADRRPAGWNQWAEVVGRDPREPRYIGDMPHAWVHSDFARSALDGFAFERGDDTLVLAAGVPPSWLSGTGIAISRLATPWGALGYTLSEAANKLVLEIDAGPLPPGGFVLPWPYPAGTASPGATRINGRPARWTGTPAELRITARPARVVISLQHP